MKQIKAVVIILLFSANAYASENWYITDSKGFGYYLTTEIKNSTIKGHTRKNALKEIVGRAKYTLVKLTSSIKHPEIIYLSGKVNGNKISGEIQNLFSKRNFTGLISPNSLVINVKQKNGEYRQLTGHKVNAIKAKRDYKSTFEQIFELTEKNLYKQSFLKTKEWEKFKHKMLELSPKIKDDLEMQITFYAIVRNFPFSHYQLKPKNTKNHIESHTKSFATLTEIDRDTVVLDIDSFTGTKQQMISLLEQVEKNKYKNLIVDLRDNNGGNFLSAYPLGQYLIKKPIIAGVFPNQRWYNQYNRTPTTEEYSQFSEFSGGTMEQWMNKASEKYGVYYKVYPSQNHFNGKVYILTNRNTASTCEPLVYAFKQEKIATIVGENTSGAMLSMNYFDVDDDISLGIPLNDYITYSGQRIDQVGIAPDVKTTSKEALTKVLEMIKQ